MYQQLDICLGERTIARSWLSQFDLIPTIWEAKRRLGRKLKLMMTWVTSIHDRRGELEGFFFSEDEVRTFVKQALW